jgi:hypothetical protein
MSRAISRRAILRGFGAAVALPWLEAMAARAAGSGPLRMAFLYVPNGVHLPDWTPQKTGSDFALPKILEPLAAFKDEMLVLSGLEQDGGWAHGDGGGDHARALGSFLTGTHPRKTDGADIRAGISVDQVAAQKVGRETRLPSLELGIERGAQAGNCDSGYSCAYSSNIAWRSESTPVPKEVNPRLVFERLFAGPSGPETAAARARRERRRKSILDFVLDDAKDLQGRLGQTDRRKLDEYLTSVREVEQRVARAGGKGDDPAPSGLMRPDGVPKDLTEHIRLMADLLALAFQADVTRVATLMFANEGSNRSYAFLGFSEGHHDLSHHGGDTQKHDKIRQINIYHVQQLSYFLEKLKTVREGDGTLLDRSMIVYGSGLGDGNRHNHDDLPILLFGKGGGTVRTGRHLQCEKKTPLNNLYLAMLARMGAPVDSLGNSTGRLALD